MRFRLPAPASRTRRRAALAVAAAFLLAGSAAAGDYDLDCDVVAGIPTLRLAAPAHVALRSFPLDSRTWILELDAPRLPGLGWGSRTCVAVTSLRVLPGDLLGHSRSRIVLTHSGQAPRSLEERGRIRLTWLPERATSAEGRETRAELEPELRELEPELTELEPELRESDTTAWNEHPAPADAEAAPRPIEAALSFGEPPAEPLRVEAAPRRERGAGAGFSRFGTPTTLIVGVPTDLKEGPGRRFASLRSLSTGERVVVTGRSGDWYAAEGGEGWIFATYLEPVERGRGPSASLSTVQEVTVPVHEGPGGQHAVVAELYRGQQVVIDELNGEWAHVRNGGWVRRTTLGDMTPGQESHR